MKGFSRRTPVSDAIHWVDAHSGRRETERIPLASGAGRVLAEDIVSPVSVPQFTRGMMDGYAVRAADTSGATSYNRLQLHVVGVVLPGQRHDGVLATGEAIRIMTGSRLPDGADAVVPVEETVLVGDFVGVTDAVAPGKHVGRIGEDIEQGHVVLNAGRRLRPQDVGVLSSIGVGELPVIRRPNVRIVLTGNELLPPGSLPRDELITDANSPMLAALIERDGGIPHHPGIVPDREDAIRSALQEPADIVLVSGGSSVGQEDYAPKVLAEDGELAIHGISMRPSSPTGMGLLADKLVFLLPGNPVSCLCAYDFFAGRAIRQMSGRSSEWPYVIAKGQLTRKLVSVVGRVDYARVRRDGESVEPIAIGGASLLSTTTIADGFVVIPENSEGFAEGSTVEVRCYD